jgi:hypothetical protein
MSSQRSRLLAIVFVSCGLAGCGMAVPNIKEAWDQDYPGDPTSKPSPTPPIAGAGQIEFEIKKRIFCELASAVQTANHYNRTVTVGKEVVKSGGLIPADWGAQTSLSLEVDESSALNPGVALNTPIIPGTHTFPGGVALPASQSAQSYSFGLGGTLSSTATRIDKFDAYYSVAKLLEPFGPNSKCNSAKPENDAFVRIGVTPAQSSPLIVSDLGLTDWLVGAMFTNAQIPSVAQVPRPTTPADLRAERARLYNQGYSSAEVTLIMASKASPSAGSAGGATPKPDTVSIEIKFIIVSSGNVTPTWHLVRVSANTGTAPLFGVGRTRTHDLIITIGPPTLATADTHLASQIGSSVAAQIGSSVGSALTIP